MDFLLMLIIYCVLFIIGTLCMLYRDSAVLCTGPVGILRNLVAEAMGRVIPGSFQCLISRFCSYLLYSRNSFFQVVFAVLVILGHAVWLVDMIPILYHHYPKKNHTFWPLVVVFVNYYCWHRAWTDDPGEIRPTNHATYMSIYEADGAMYSGKDTCSTCKLRKPARSKHCSVCNRCVHRFDHHCIWTNNCVGAINHRFFILFMVTLLTMFIQGIYVGSGCVLDHAADIRLFKASFVDDDGAVKPVTVSVAFQHLFMELPRLVFLVISLVVLTILVGIFLMHHLYLVMTNQTTNERYKLHSLQTRAKDDNHICSHQRIGTESASHLKHEVKSNVYQHFKGYRPYSRGFFNNFMEVFLPHRFIQSRIKR